MLVNKIDLENALEVFQIYTITEAIMYAEPLPANTDVMLSVAKVIKKNSNRLIKELIDKESQIYHGKRNTLREYTR